MPSVPSRTLPGGTRLLEPFLGGVPPHQVIWALPGQGPCRVIGVTSVFADVSGKLLVSRPGYVVMSEVFPSKVEEDSANEPRT